MPARPPGPQAGDLPPGGSLDRYVLPLAFCTALGLFAAALSWAVPKLSTQVSAPPRPLRTPR